MRMPRGLRTGLRLARTGTHLLSAALVVGFVYPCVTETLRLRLRQRWSRALLDILGLRLAVDGAVTSGGALLVANHVSWLDIFAINAAVPTRFVAKSEVRAWPLVGWLCVKADTLFIERERRRDLARIDELLAQALRQRAGMGVFLEGTTSDGSEVLPFHSSLLRPAQAVNVPIYPVAIQYRRRDGSLCTEAAYDGDKTLLDSVRLMLTQHEIYAHVHFLPPLTPNGMHRRELAQHLRAAIIARLHS